MEKKKFNYTPTLVFTLALCSIVEKYNVILKDVTVRLSESLSLARARAHCHKKHSCTAFFLFKRALCPFIKSEKNNNIFFEIKISPTVEKCSYPQTSKKTNNLKYFTKHSPDKPIQLYLGK